MSTQRERENVVPKKMNECSESRGNKFPDLKVKSHKQSWGESGQVLRFGVSFVNLLPVGELRKNFCHALSVLQQKNVGIVVALW